MNVLAIREATKWAADYCRAGKVGGAVIRGGAGKVGGAVIRGGEGGWDCSAGQGR